MRQHILKQNHPKHHSCGIAFVFKYICCKYLRVSRKQSCRAMCKVSYERKSNGIPSLCCSCIWCRWYIRLSCKLWNVLLIVHGHKHSFAHFIPLGYIYWLAFILQPYTIQNARYGWHSQPQMISVCIGRRFIICKDISLKMKCRAASQSCVSNRGS